MKGKKQRKRPVPCQLILALLMMILLAFFSGGCGRKPVGTPLSGKAVPAGGRPYIVNGRKYYPLPSARGFVEEGYASWYGEDFHGRPTASGEPYDMYAATAAHKILPLGTCVRVTNLENGREVVCRVNDRGPFVKNRVIDLSYASARRLGMIGKGTARVRVEALGEATVENRRVIFKTIPDAKTGNFYVQVGAFLDGRRAAALKKRLGKTYSDIVVSRDFSGSRTWYRVQVFASRSYKDAKAVELVLERTVNPDAFVVAR